MLHLAILSYSTLSTYEDQKKAIETLKRTTTTTTFKVSELFSGSKGNASVFFFFFVFYTPFIWNTTSVLHLTYMNLYAHILTISFTSYVDKGAWLRKRFVQLPVLILA